MATEWWRQCRLNCGTQTGSRIPMNNQTELTPRLPDGRWALFLDIDGTLLEHAAHPDAVSVSEELRTLLGSIEQRLDGAVAFITGRSVSAADRLFYPLK